MEKLPRIKKNERALSLGEVKKYHIKEVHLKLFYDFIERLDKIPDTVSKISYLRGGLYKPPKIVPFRVLVKYYIERLISEEVPKVKVLPLQTEDENERVTSYVLNLPQIDLLLVKGLNSNRFRQAIEDWIYSTKGVVQRFLCNYANGDNIFKIPKTDLKDLIETPRLRIENCKIYDLKILSEQFVGYNQSYLENMKFVPEDYIKKKPEMILPSSRVVDIFTRNFWKRLYVTKNIRNSKKYDVRIEEGITLSFRYKFPAMVYTTNENESPMIYFIRRNDLTHTNLKGMFLQQFLFLAGKVKHLALAGYYRGDTFYLTVCTYDEWVVRTIIEGKASKYQNNPISYMNGYNTLQERVKERETKYKTSLKFKIQRMNMTPLMNMEGLLNYLYLNKKKASENLLVMFANNLIVSPVHIIVPCVVLSFDAKTNNITVQTLDEKKEIYKVHYERISGKPNDIKYYIGKTAHLFLFEIGGNFLLMEIYKEFTLDNHEYQKNSLVKYTKY